MKNTFMIKKNKILKYVLKKGTYYASKYVVVHRINNNCDNENCLAICVSKKNGISVHRNKLKRWAREVYKIEEDYLKKGNNIVILYKKTTTLDDIDFNILKEDIIKCFKGLELYEDN